MAKGNKRVSINDRYGCEFCRREVDHAALGHDLRVEREKMGIAQREVAREMKVSATFLCDLEAGRRNWTAKKMEQYLNAVRGIKP